MGGEKIKRAEKIGKGRRGEKWWAKKEDIEICPISQNVFEYREALTSGKASNYERSELPCMC